jgi:hypothetical protein
VFDFPAAVTLVVSRKVRLELQNAHAEYSGRRAADHALSTDLAPLTSIGSQKTNTDTMTCRWNGLSGSLPVRSCRSARRFSLTRSAGARGGTAHLFSCRISQKPESAPGSKSAVKVVGDGAELC